MKKFLLDPLFLAGLVLRLVIIGISTPAAITQWYVPFMQSSLAHFTLDPWGTWVNGGGTLRAFPYGYGMWICLLPLSLLFKTLGLSLAYAYSATLLAGDLALLWLLGKLAPASARLLLVVYWLSPIVFIASYLLGLNDLLPVTLLVAALYLFKQHRLLVAGLVFAGAVSTKLSMLLALPFFVVFLAHNKSHQRFAKDFFIGLSIGAVFLLLPFFVASSSGVKMLFGNPEMSKVFSLTLDLGPSFAIYLVPLAYILVLYSAWRIRRMNYDLFQAMLGLSFMVVVLMTPASPGWFIWLIPLLLTYQAYSDRIAFLLASLFALLYVFSSILNLTPGSVVIGNLPLGAGELVRLPMSVVERSASLIYTAMVAIGAILALRIWREAVRRNDFFRLSRKPFVLGVGGDSGAGKDTFAEAIAGLFGHDATTMLTGDDYHLWDRQKPMWQVVTHLNPTANDLERFAGDLVALIDGKTIQSRHYDHITGQMTRPRAIKSNDFIIASGLHALYLPLLRRCYNLSIYLDIDEGLRRYFKMERDVKVRGHSIAQVDASFLRREPDANRFIRPQAEQADLILSLQPIHPRMLSEVTTNETLRFKLVVKSRQGLSEMSLTRILIGICGLHVDAIVSNDPTRVAYAIEGETTAADIELAARMVCPRLFEFLDAAPQWQNGPLGLMQLITLAHINQALTTRFI